MRLLFIFSLCLISCTSIKQHNAIVAKPHTVEALHSDIDKLYLQLKKHHPKLYQYIPKAKFEQKIDSLKQRIDTPLTSREFYKKVAPLLAQIRQGHLSIKPPGIRFNKKERKALKEKKFEFYALDFEYLDNKLWVKRTVGKDSSLVGAQILSIDNEPIEALLASYKTRFASDGYNTTLHNRFLGRGFKRLYVRDKGFLDSLKITVKQHDSIYTKLLKRISKKKKKADTLKNITDTLKIKRVPLTKTQKKAKKQKRKERKNRGFISRSKEYMRNFNFIGKDSTVAYMKIRGFSNGRYRPFYKESFKQINASNTKNLIIDLRDNGGGRIAEIAYLYSFLADAPYQFTNKSEVTNRMPIFKLTMAKTTPLTIKIAAGLVAPLFIAHDVLRTKKENGKFYYNISGSKIKHPREDRYKGAIYVLTNGNSFSASSLISTHLKATKRAKFIGEETGGAYNGCVAGFYKLYKLPETQLTARIGVMQIEAPYKQLPDGFGIKPDVEIVPTASDRKKGRDPELEWILKEIKQYD